MISILPSGKGIERGVGKSKKNAIPPAKMGGLDDTVFESKKREMIRAGVAEILENMHSHNIKDIEYKKGGGIPVGDSIAEYEFRYSCLREYGVDIITDLLAEDKERYPKPGGYAPIAHSFLGKLYLKGQPCGEELFSKISQEIGAGSEVGSSILESLAEPKDDLDWVKSLNDCDMYDLGVEMKKYRESEYENICSAIFQKFREQIKAFLVEGDLSGIRKAIKDMIKPKFRKAYERFTADTPERKRERILYPLIRHGLDRYAGIQAGKKLEKRMADICREKSVAPFNQEELVKAHRLLRLHHDYPMDNYVGMQNDRMAQEDKFIVGRDHDKYVRQVMEMFLGKYGEALVKKVGVDYKIADPERFEVLVENQYKEELEKVARQIIAGRRNEKHAGQVEQVPGYYPIRYR